MADTESYIPEDEDEHAHGAALIAGWAAAALLIAAFWWVVLQFAWLVAGGVGLVTVGASVAFAVGFVWVAAGTDNPTW